MAVVEATGEDAADGWSSMLTDAVAKSGRESDRRLYMYGISSNRCPKCQARLKSSSNTCDSCHYTHKKLRKCMRCNQKNDPVMWCAECDAYFCAKCHKKPHVLMLGSSKPHHCFVIDGASGKHFVDAAWSDEFSAMMHATYRLRLHDKILADEAAASKEPASAPTPQQPASVTTGHPKPPVPTGTLSFPRQPLQPAKSSTISIGPRPTSVVTTTNGTTAGSSASASTAPPTGKSSLGTSLHTQEQPRKRQLPVPADTGDRGQKSIRSEGSPRSGVASAATPSDGMSLYERVKALHDSRTRPSQSKSPQARSPKMSLDQLLSQRKGERTKQQKQQQGGQGQIDRTLQQQRGQQQQQQQEQERAERLRIEQKKLEEERAKHVRNEQQQLEHERAERLRMEQLQLEEQRRQNERRRQEEIQRQEELWRQKELRKRQEEQRRQEELRRQEEQRQEDLRRHAEQRRQEDQQRQQRLLNERMRHEQLLREQEEERRHHQGQTQARILMHESSQFISQAQHVLRTQPGYVGTSMAPPTISAPMQQTSGIQFTRIPSPITSVSPHGQPFQTVSSGFASAGSEHGAPVYQNQGPVMESRFETVQEHEGDHRMVVRDPNAQRQQNEQQQKEFSDAMVPHRGAGTFSPRTSGEDDELRAIWVSDYDNVNALVMQLEVEIAKKTEEGHAFVHRSNNITIPEQLKLQINNLRAQREQALTKRLQSVVRVLIFSGALRTFAQATSDVPDVLKVSHKKCAELAIEIRQFERQAQKLREGIDEAVSSGNPAQMQNVAHLGALIADLERKIRVSNAERDKQFIFMFQFSDTIRNMVRTEWATSGRPSQDNQLSRGS
ncbi:hypothetical protein PRIC1_008850 [Phytophthora ramorum]